MKLLFVTPRFFPYLGGVESHVYQVVTRLAAGGIDTTVLTTDPERKLPASEELEGVKILRVRAWPAGRDYYFAPDIYRIIRQGSWDIIHVQSYHTLVAPVAMLAAWRKRTPYVLTFHGGGHSSRLRNALRGVQTRLLRPLLAHADRLVAIARFEIDFFGKKLGIPQERFVYIPNGADLPQPPKPDPPASKTVLIASVGRLERYKGHHRILAALPYILKVQPEARLWIAGSGPYEPALHRLAGKLGVSERVEIRAIPPSDRQAMAAELSKAKLVVLLSDYETHPIAVLEALALGRPALVADTSGLRELAECGLALAIPLTSTPEQIAAAALEQLRQPLAPSPFQLPTWDECAASLLATYQEILRRRDCAS